MSYPKSTCTCLCHQPPAISHGCPCGQAPEKPSCKYCGGEHNQASCPLLSVREDSKQDCVCYWEHEGPGHFDDCPNYQDTEIVGNLTGRELIHKWFGGESGRLIDELGRAKVLEMARICERRRG